MITQNELIKYFLSEAEDHINTLIEGIEDLETKGYTKETLESLFRATHTLKGSAAIVKLDKISFLSHKLEDLFEAILNGEIKYDNSLNRVIKNVINLISLYINEVSTNEAEKTELNQDIINLLDNILEKKEAVIEQPEVVTTFEALPIVNTVRVDIRAIDNILTLLGEILVQKNAITDKEKELEEIIEGISHSSKRLINEINAFSDRYWLVTQDKQQKITDSFFTDFSDLEFDRYDEYHIFLRKIQEITNDIAEAINSLFSYSEHLSSNLKSFSREIGYLKDNLIEMRMIPISRLLHRLSESAKDIAKDTGKKVQIEIKGSEIKVDRPIYDAIYEPLFHILRNALNHGIESPEERIRKGKSETGSITIEVKKEGKNIVINIKDDGRGINLPKVKERAIQKGLLTADKAPFVSNEELFSFIFMPGFSTVDNVDLLKGRGVGLDIVKTEISKLKGTVEVFSEIDKGTIFTIKIPQSLSISNLIIFKAYELEFAIPLSYIEEVLTIEDFPEIKRERKITHKDRNIPVKFFHELFFSSNGKSLEKGYIIVFNFSGMRKGLVVEEILGYEEATIHPLGKFLAGLTQYLGYFISGKGTLRYVVDPLRIFEEEFLFISPEVIQVSTVSAGKVLIVDDSISVRKSLQSLLESKNLKVYAAKDGLEALNLLEEKNVDLIITDLEMPVMHGYEFITRVRKDPRFNDIPIVVLTSRGTKRHEQKAIDAGADGYIIKPFDEVTISEILSKFGIIK